MLHSTEIPEEESFFSGEDIVCRLFPQVSNLVRCKKIFAK